MFLYVDDGPCHPKNILFEVADSDVAVVAEQRSNSAGNVVVVHISCFFLKTDGAGAVLLEVHSIKLKTIKTVHTNTRQVCTAS